jgi:hypothetical protein
MGVGTLLVRLSRSDMTNFLLQLCTYDTNVNSIKIHIYISTLVFRAPEPNYRMGPKATHFRL